MDTMRARLAFLTVLAVPACSSVDAGVSETDAVLTDPGTSQPAPTTSGGEEAGSLSATDSASASQGEGTSDEPPPTSNTDPTTFPATSSGSTGAASLTDPTGNDDATGNDDDGTTTFDPQGVVPPGSTIPVGGDDHFLLGANYPWRSYGGDFGGNGWGVYGVHTAPNAYDADFATMTGARLEVIRWFVFTDGRAGIVFDNSGTPTGLGDYVLDDFNAAITIAKQRGAYLVPVLLDFHWMFWAKQEGPVQVSGRSDTITDPVKRAALVDNVFIPLFDQYADEPAILAWEVMNEPEWSLKDIPDGQPDGQANAVPLGDFYALAAATADAVHDHTGAYFTLGSACLKWLKIWTPEFALKNGFPTIAMDFYQVHYYPWMDGQSWTDHPDYGSLKFSPMEQPYASLGLDHPLVVGELIISDSAGQRLDTLKANGYAGVWPWSLKSDYSLDLPGLKAWGDAHAALVDLPAP